MRLTTGNTYNLRKFPKQFLFQIFMNATLSVESFVFFSAFITAYYFFRSNHRSFPFFYYANRIVRSMFMLAIVIAVCIIWLAISSGPLWHESIYSATMNCRKNWWKTLLFYSNFQKMDDIVRSLRILIFLIKKNTLIILLKTFIFVFY